MSTASLFGFFHSLWSLLAAEGVGVGVAAVLIASLAFALPAGTKRRIRGPLLLLLANLLVLALRVLVGPTGTAGKALPILGAFFLAASIGQSAFLLVLDAIFGKRRDQPLPRIFRDIAQGVILIAVVLITLRAAGVEPTSLLTTSALLTAVIGLSLQDTLGNLFAGLSIQAQRPFEVGDWIQIDPDPRFIGRVIEINWRATTVLTAEQVELIIPNGMLAKSTIRNFTKPSGISRRTVELQAPYDVQPQRVEKALLSSIQGITGVRTEPSPFVLIARFADSWVMYHLNYFIDDFTQRDRVDSMVRQRIWFALQRAGIAIPFPTRMMIQTQDATPEARAKTEAEEQARRLAAIKGVDFLATIPEPALERLASLSKSCQYVAGEVIIRQGDVGHELYIVRTGEVSVLLGRGAEGSVAELARLGPGKFFGEMSLMTGARRAATVQATLDCELVRIDKEAFQDILASDPRLVEEITQVLVDRQIEMEENLSARTAARSQKYKEEKSSALLAAIKEFFSLS
ncbi:MAG: mechanosensitive ion channel [Polyangiaceae bacterium]|nr:mechanosensitive ion channel family protein [Polyangiaceae bacterium]NUQ79443.1 mechanosensitive ion channel [Polyangiaceae bacterium]